jgi:CRISPR/Cas system-associated endonuclease Cas1
LVSFAVLGSLSAGVVWMNGSLKNLAGQVEYREVAIRNAQLMATEFQTNESRANEIAAKLEEHKGANLSAHLEKAAQSVGIADRLDGVKESSSSITGDLEEKLYTASLSKLSLEDVTNFLYEIETSGFPLVVQSAKFKTRMRSQVKEIKLTLSIAAYSLVATEGGEG